VCEKNILFIKGKKGTIYARKAPFMGA